MSPRTTLTRLGIAAATTALSVGAVSPALASPADDDPGQQNSSGNSWNQQQQQSNQNSQNSQNSNDGGDQQSSNSWNQQQNSSGNNDWGQHNGNNNSDAGLYKGIVTANGGLRLRSAPNRGSAIIRVVPKGEIVNIFCKTGGENVDGNSLWYLLTDGTWAWGAARYINNIGAAPRFC